jgi:hypothetical protein
MPNLETERTCPKCGSWKPIEDFEGRKYCASCRAIAAEGMRRYHERKRLGIRVSRGRPNVVDATAAVMRTFSIPQAIVQEVETYVANRVLEYLKEHVPNNRASDLPLGFTYGKDLNMPTTPRGKPAVSRSSKKGARSAEDELFLEHCRPDIAALLSTQSAVIFELRRKQWEKAGKPKDWWPNWKPSAPEDDGTTSPA